MVVPSIRAAILFIALAVAACLPNLAAEWLFPISVAGSFAGSAGAQGPGSTDVSEDSAATSLERHLRSLPAVEEPEAAPHLYDVRGNEIVRPVARYGVDHRGSLYELHSPHTELPKLEPPEL